jgi:PHD/YefM family antitoxin component YafN of YafNO toxin-antitoxin module
MTRCTVKDSLINLNQLIDETANSHEPIFLTGAKNNAVLISEDAWSAIQETLCLIYILHKKTINIWQPQSLWWSFLWIYPPLITVVYLIKNYLFLQKKNNTFFKNESIIKLQLNYYFWFCLYFCIIHCIMIFFTQDRLHSLGRYIFATPFFYISLAYLVTVFVHHKINRLLFFFIGISGLMLMEQWIRYGKNLWLR